MKNKAFLFDKALEYHHISKKDFAEKSGIPYDTVAGWKKRGEVPNYAIVMLKKFAMERHRGYTMRVNKVGKYTGHKTIDPKLAKRIEAAFWGKNIGYDGIIRAVRRGDPAFVQPFFENLYFKDILAVLGQKQINKLLPTLDKQFDQKTHAFWKQVAVAEIA